MNTNSEKLIVVEDQITINQLLTDKFKICDTYDSDTACEIIMRELDIDKLNFFCDLPSSPVRVFLTSEENTELINISFGRKTHMFKSEEDKYVNIDLILKGTARFNIRKSLYPLTSGSAIIYDASNSVNCLMDEACSYASLRVKKNSLSAFYEMYTGEHMSSSDLSGKIVSCNIIERYKWKNLFLLRDDTLDSTLSARRRTSLLRHAEELVMINLINAIEPAPLSSWASPSQRPTPATLRRALNYIEENALETPTLTEIATAACCSIRTLQRIFVEILDVSPMQHLKNVRLQHAHLRLLNAGSDEKVTSIALECGFTHLGQFSGDYKKMFGELPSETLHRSIS